MKRYAIMPVLGSPNSSWIFYTGSILCRKRLFNQYAKLVNKICVWFQSNVKTLTENHVREKLRPGAYSLTHNFRLWNIVRYALFKVQIYIKILWNIENRKIVLMLVNQSHSETFVCLKKRTSFYLKTIGCLYIFHHQFKI